MLGGAAIGGIVPNDRRLSVRGETGKVSGMLIVGPRPDCETVLTSGPLTPPRLFGPFFFLNLKDVGQCVCLSQTRRKSRLATSPKIMSTAVVSFF